MTDVGICTVPTQEMCLVDIGSRESGWIWLDVKVAGYGYIHQCTTTKFLGYQTLRGPRPVTWSQRFITFDTNGSVKTIT